MPGGAQALNNPAAQEAARKSFGAAVKSAIKGGAEEISQEAIDGGFNHILTEMHKGRTFEQAATSYAEQFPQSALTSALLGGGVQAMADKKNSSAPEPQQPATAPQQVPLPGHAAPSGQPNGKQSFSTVDAEGREIPPSDTPEPGAPIAPVNIPRPSAATEPAPGPSIPQSTTQSVTSSGPEAPATAPGSQPPQKPGTAPSSPTGIPDSTTPSTASAPPGMEPSKEAASAGPVMTMENGGQVLDTIDRLKAKEKNGALTKDEQIELHHNENILARTQATNLEAKQKALSKLPTPRELHSTELAALAKAKAMLARPWPGTAPKPEPQTATAATTQSSSGPLPPGDTSTTHGVTPPTGTATSSQAGTGNTTGSTTSTASSGDAPATAPGSGTHTTNSVTAPPVGHGNRIPEDATHPEHIDLANRRVENLGKIAAKRKLDPHEQDIYDNALRVRDRNSPAQPGDRNSSLPQGTRDTGNPEDLAMSGDADALVPVTPDGEDATLDTEAVPPPPSTPAQPANAVGKPINGPSTANPDAPTASTASSPTPPQAGPAGVSAGTPVPAPTPASPPSGNPVSATTAASAPPALSGSSAGGASPSTGSNSSPSSPSPASVSPAGNGAGSTPPPSYPPIDHSHTIGAEINRRNQATGGHSLLRGDVDIIPGTETAANAQGVYQARVQMRHPVTGAWIPKTSNGGMNTMFPKHWTEAQIRSEVDAAWNSPHKVINPTTRIWRAPSPSGIIIEGYINPHRVTAYPKP